MPFLTFTSSIISYVLTSLGLMYMFQKAGVPKWYAWIPIYNVYWLIKISFSGMWVFILYIIGILINVIMQIMNTSLGLTSAFNSYSSAPDLSDSQIIGYAVIILILGLIYCVTILIYYIYTAIKISKAFGCGGGMIALLILLPVIAYMVLGFGSAQYMGNSNTISSQNNGY